MDTSTDISADDHPPARSILASRGGIRGAAPPIGASNHKSPSSIGTSTPDPAGPTPVLEQREWVDRIRQGDHEAFAHLFQRFYPELCEFAAAYVGSFDAARESVQIVMTRIWERRACLFISTSIRGYLFRAVRNQALNDRRNERRRRTSSLDADPKLLNLRAPGDPADGLGLRERVAQIQQAIDGLPERQRAAFLLHRRHKLTYSEIAETMEISPRTVEVHISKALQSLHRALSA